VHSLHAEMAFGPFDLGCGFVAPTSSAEAYVVLDTGNIYVGGPGPLIGPWPFKLSIQSSIVACYLLESHSKTLSVNVS
jgi:hypothetical protein